MVAHLTVNHSDLLDHPHFLLEHMPLFAVVSERFVCFDRLIVVFELYHDVPLCLEQAVEQQFVFKEWITTGDIFFDETFK